MPDLKVPSSSLPSYIPKGFSDNKPIQLVSINDDGILTVNPIAIEILNSPPYVNLTPIVFGIVGTYRTGKSLLLNLLTGISKDELAFPVGSTINACTRGIWMLLSSVNEDHYYIALDCEGSGNVNFDKFYDTKIISLVVIIASVFIYNSMGVIDETSIQNLSLVTEFARSTLSSVDDNHFLSKSLFWVLRDFVLELVNANGDQITGDDYLQIALNSGSITGHTSGNSSNEFLRTNLKKLFTTRHCHPLIMPITDDDELQKVNLKSLRPEFIDQVNVLRESIFESGYLNFKNRKSLSTKSLCVLLTSFVDKINSGQVPQITGDSWNLICMNECEVLCHKIYGERSSNQEYIYDKIREITNNDVYANFNVHDKIYIEYIVNYFKSTAVGPSDLIDDFIENTLCKDHLPILLKISDEYLTRNLKEHCIDIYKSKSAPIFNQISQWISSREFNQTETNATTEFHQRVCRIPQLYIEELENTVCDFDVGTMAPNLQKIDKIEEEPIISHDIESYFYSMFHTDYVKIKGIFENRLTSLKNITMTKDTYDLTKEEEINRLTAERAKARQERIAIAEAKKDSKLSDRHVEKLNDTNNHESNKYEEMQMELDRLKDEINRQKLIEEERVREDEKRRESQCMAKCRACVLM